MSPGTKSKLPNRPGVRVRPKSPSSNNPGTHQENPPKRFRRALFKDHPSSPQLDNLFALRSVDKDVARKRSRSGQGQGKFKGLIVDANYYLNCITFLQTKMMPTSALVAKDTTKRRKQKCGLVVMSRRITGGTIDVLDIAESHQQKQSSAALCAKPVSLTILVNPQSFKTSLISPQVR